MSLLPINQESHSRARYMILAITRGWGMCVERCIDTIFLFQIKLTGMDNKAMGGEAVYLYVNVNHASYNITLRTKNNGVALFSLDTSLWKDSVSLEVCPLHLYITARSALVQTHSSGFSGILPHQKSYMLGWPPRLGTGSSIKCFFR